MVAGRVAEIADPAFECFLVEEEFVGYFGVVASAVSEDVPRCFEIGRCVSGERFGQLPCLGSEQVVELFLLVGDLLGILLVLLDGLFIRKRELIDLAAVEDAEQRVVVLGGNGVELVVVALRALYGEAEEPASGSVDAIVLELRTEAVERQARDKIRILAAFKEISGDLRLHEPVVRHVVVESLNDPIAIAVSVRIGFHLRRVQLVVRIAGDVEPIAAPALAIARGREQVVDDLGERIRRFVLNEGANLFRGRRQADQVEIGAA